MSRVAIVLLIAACSQAPLTAQIASEGTEPKAASFERDIKLLQKWPEREGRAASRRLALAGAQGADRLLPLLEHRDWRFRAGAAHTLGLIGEHRAFDLLRKGVSDVGNRIALGTYFEAMIRLDPAAGSAEVLPYLRSASPRTSKAAFEALPRKLPASLRQEVEKLWGDSSQILRLRGLKLALRFDPPPAKTVYFRFLGDRNPGICRLVAQELSESDDSELVDDLNRLVRAGGIWSDLSL